MNQRLKALVSRLFHSRVIQFILRKIKFIILRYPIVKRVIIKLLALTPGVRVYLEQVWISTEKRQGNKAKPQINYLHQISSKNILLPGAKAINVKVETVKSKVE